MAAKARIANFILILILSNECVDFVIAEVQAGDPFIKQFRPFSWKLSETSMGL